jgi:hypothetical protein
LSLRYKLKKMIQFLLCIHCKVIIDIFHTFRVVQRAMIRNNNNNLYICKISGQLYTEKIKDVLEKLKYD